jgi:hypothetical protein
MTCESELAGVPDPSHGPKRGGAVLKQRSIIGSEPISIIPMVLCAAAWKRGTGFERRGEDEIVVNLADHAPHAGAGAQGECSGGLRTSQFRSYLRVRTDPSSLSDCVSRCRLGHRTGICQANKKAVLALLLV